MPYNVNEVGQMLLVIYMVLFLFSIILNTHGKENNIWFVKLLLAYSAITSFVCTDTWLDFSLLLISSIILYVLLILFKQEVNLSMIVVTVVLIMMLSLIIGLSESFSLVTSVNLFFYLYLPILIFGPKIHVSKKMNLLYVAFLLIFVSGLFFTSFEREQHLNNKIMYIAEDFMKEEFDKKNGPLAHVMVLGLKIQSYL